MTHCGILWVSPLAADAWHTADDARRFDKDRRCGKELRHADSLLSSPPSASPPFAFALAALAGLGLVTARPAAAQHLSVGTYTPPATGSATISDFGTVASGSYQYYDQSFNPLPLDTSTTHYTSVTDYYDSTLTFTGGSADGVSFGGDATTTGKLTVSGGTLGVVDVFYPANGDVDVSGGSIGSLNTTGSGLDTITGGTVGEVSTIGGTVDISGGSVDKIRTQAHTQVNVSGGKINSIEGDSDGGTFDFFGTGFTVTPTGLSGIYNFQGVLSNGDALNVEFGVIYGTHIEFNGVEFAINPPVPEASTTVSFGLLLALGMGGILIAAKRKKAGSAA